MEGEMRNVVIGLLFVVLGSVFGQTIEWSEPIEIYNGGLDFTYWVYDAIITEEGLLVAWSQSNGICARTWSNDGSLQPVDSFWIDSTTIRDVDRIDLFRRANGEIWILANAVWLPGPTRGLFAMRKIHDEWRDLSPGAGAVCVCPYETTEGQFGFYSINLANMYLEDSTWNAIGVSPSIWAFPHAYQNIEDSLIVLFESYSLSEGNYYIINAVFVDLELCYTDTISIFSDEIPFLGGSLDDKNQLQPKGRNSWVGVTIKPGTGVSLIAWFGDTICVVLDTLDRGAPISNSRPMVSIDSTGKPWIAWNHRTDFSDSVDHSYVIIARFEDMRWEIVDTFRIDTVFYNPRIYFDNDTTSPAYLLWEMRDVETGTFGLRGAKRIVDNIPDRDVFSPNRFSLSAHPNPFNSSVRIAVEGVGDGSPVPFEVEIYDVNGRRIAKLPVGEGLKPSRLLTVTQTGGSETTPLQNGEFIWQPAPSLPSGVYLVRATVGEETATRRVVYLK